MGTCFLRLSSLIAFVFQLLKQLRTVIEISLFGWSFLPFKMNPPRPDGALPPFSGYDLKNDLILKHLTLLWRLFATTPAGEELASCSANVRPR